MAMEDLKKILQGTHAYILDIAILNFDIEGVLFKKIL